MDKAVFWSLLEQNKQTSPGEMPEGLLQALAGLPPEELLTFHGYLNAYMEQVNDCIWVDMGCKVINGYVSDDTGLYFALWLIAQGEKVLLAALADPDSLAELPGIPFGIADFELLMGAGLDETADYEATQRIMEKCSKEIAPSIVYKGGSKYGDYVDFDEGMADIPNLLPNLIQRAKEAGFNWEEFI